MRQILEKNVEVGVQDAENPPPVNSVSYGNDEAHAACGPCREEALNRNPREAPYGDLIPIPPKWFFY